MCGIDNSLAYSTPRTIQNAESIFSDEESPYIHRHAIPLQKNLYTQHLSKPTKGSHSIL